MKGKNYELSSEYDSNTNKLEDLCKERSDLISMSLYLRRRPSHKRVVKIQKLDRIIERLNKRQINLRNQISEL